MWLSGESIAKSPKLNFFLSRDPKSFPSGLKQLKSVENFISDVDGKVRVHAYFVELSG